MKNFKTHCPCCLTEFVFDIEYLNMNKFRDAIFFKCENCNGIYFSDTFGGEPIAYYDDEKIVDLREIAYDENGTYIL